MLRLRTAVAATTLLVLTAVAYGGLPEGPAIEKVAPPVVVVAPPPVAAPTPPPAPAPAPARQDDLSPLAERLYYEEPLRAWGSACRLPQRGYASVKHVTDNGTPALGPPDKVTADNGPSDWSFLGVDPMTLDANDYPQIVVGMPLFIHGFVARDRRGQVVPGVAYMDDPEKPYWWMELRDEASDDFGRSIIAEGVLGGFSGSCVLDGEGRIVAVTHANGFSEIKDTTDTWAKIVPLRDAILEAQGKADFSAPSSFARIPGKPLPVLEPMELNMRGQLSTVMRGD